jgi:hypothetical protein
VAGLEITMPDTGAPWNIPYVAPTDNPRVYPAADEAAALAVAAGLTAAGVVKQVKQVITETDFTTTSTTFVDLTGVSVTITPSDPANRILMEFVCSSQNGAGSQSNIFRFRRDTTNIFEEVVDQTSDTNRPRSLAMTFDEVAGSTAARDYLVRIKVTGNTGTVFSSSLIVTEYAP